MDVARIHFTSVARKLLGVYSPLAPMVPTPMLMAKHKSIILAKTKTVTTDSVCISSYSYLKSKQTRILKISIKKFKGI